MAKTLDDIFNDDDFGLLNAKEPHHNYIRTDEDRLVDSFEELNIFFEKNNREPARTSMSEYALFARLKEWRSNPAKRSLLKPFDRYNLLGEEEIVEVESIDDILENDDLGLLDLEGDSSIFDFVHTPKSGSRAEAEYIAQRKSLPEKEFQRYDMMFKQVHRELKEGKRRLLPFSDAERNLKEENFYLVDGLLAYLEVSDAEKVLKENQSGDRIRLEGRTVTVFENGTISNMLFRSLAKAIQKNGKMITNTDNDIEKQLMDNANLACEEALQSGWIYVLRSKSSNPEINAVKNLYKVGFSKLPVKDRIKNAAKEATYLFADVEVVASYNCYGIEVQALENLLHRFFGAVCLNLDIYDPSGNRFVPREWFCVPIHVIDEAIQLVLNNTIFNYRYDNREEKIVLK
ncbi:GIY-YIG nuclease family protein [Albibacterium sp.]|uniref:GIY-YIG nuclease family protein n=1 Tax=Albibacterium sp. TaxID=2952885 RepID=UPI002C5B555D|nr:GIY-YIG nuclease family protein [Albibacterium sp.]HUH18570.1 GIY-YIG nuclease family protein [Albibacterium sp.]